MSRVVPWRFSAAYSVRCPDCSHVAGEHNAVCCAFPGCRCDSDFMMVLLTKGSDGVHLRYDGTATGVSAGP